LIDNAIKYTIEGTIEIVLDLKKQNENDFLFIKVCDSGIGIPRDKIKDLFKPFSQITNSLDVTGSGLGIVITNELILLNKGKINVISNENQGTTFEIEFPVEVELIKSNFEQSANHENNLELIKNKIISDKKLIKILIADDYSENHLLIKELLKKEPFDLEFVFDGVEALQKISSSSYDIIFLDIRMPRKNGIETFLDVKRNNYDLNFRTPLIALTANSLKEEVNFYTDLGFTSVITKPFTRSDLTRIVYSNIKLK
jgi:CheY-like chemotaxis protein